MKDKRISTKRLITISFLIGIFINIASASVSAETVVIEIKDSMFGSQQPVTVKAGTTVKWLNVEKRQYYTDCFENEGLEEGDYIFPEETWERTFDKPGTYPYRCGPHEDMVGTIVVE